MNKTNCPLCGSDVYHHDGGKYGTSFYWPNKEGTCKITIPAWEIWAAKNSSEDYKKITRLRSEISILEESLIFEFNIENELYRSERNKNGTKKEKK